MTKAKWKFHLLLAIMMFACQKPQNETTDDNQLFDTIEGEWKVSFAEVINQSTKTMKADIIENVEGTALRYHYRFFPSNKFERGQPETRNAVVEEMHGTYKIDSIDRKLSFYLEWDKSERRDTVHCELIEINPYKIAYIEKWAPKIEVLTVLHRVAHNKR